MEKILLVALLPTLFLSACSDGVPKVDDPHNVVVDGKKMTQAEFMEKYCVDRPDNKTCLAVGHAGRIGATKGKLPKGW